MDDNKVTKYKIEVTMFKQLGISSLELLLSLTVISSISAYTLAMTEEVEVAAKEYQQQVDVNQLRKRIQSRHVAE